MDRVLFFTTRPCCEKQHATSNRGLDEPVQIRYGVALIDAGTADDHPSVSDVQYFSQAELLSGLCGDGPTVQSLVLFVHGLSTQFKRSLEQGFRIQQRLHQKGLGYQLALWESEAPLSSGQKKLVLVRAAFAGSPGDLPAQGEACCCLVGFCPFMSATSTSGGRSAGNRA